MYMRMLKKERFVDDICLKNIENYLDLNLIAITRLNFKRENEKNLKISSECRHFDMLT